MDNPGSLPAIYIVHQTDSYAALYAFEFSCGCNNQTTCSLLSLTPCLLYMGLVQTSCIVLFYAMQNKTWRRVAYVKKTNLIWPSPTLSNQIFPSISLSFKNGTSFQQCGILAIPFGLRAFAFCRDQNPGLRQATKPGGRDMAALYYYSCILTITCSVFLKRTSDGHAVPSVMKHWRE